MSGSTDYYSRPYELVRGQIASMSSKADASIAAANLSIETLMQSLNNGLNDVGSAPLSPSMGIDESLLSIQPDTIVTRHGGSSVSSFSMPSVPDINVIDVAMPNIQDFTSNIGSILPPERPAPIDVSGKPTRPDMQIVDIPDSPVLALPDIGNLADIQIPTFVFPELPTFDGTAPQFFDADPNTVIPWAEPDYESPNIAALQARVATMLAGGTGIPADIEDALFSRARSRDDMLSLKARQEAFDTFAGRGFQMPPGMLVAQVNAVIEDNRLKAADNNRDILTKAAQWEIENLRAAVQNGIALEGALMNLFQQMTQRTFEVAKYQVEAKVALFNAKVGLFNAQQNAYQVAASVYKTRIEGALARLEVFKAEIQAQQAKAALNDQTVKVYQARLEGVRSLVDVYKARMEGAKVQSDVNRNLIEGYRADVQAFAEDMTAQKTKFDAYESDVKAYTARVGVVESQARAFAATVQAHEATANVKIKNIDAKISAIRAETDKFTALVNAERTRVDAGVSVFNAETQAYQADIQKYVANMNNSTQRYDVAARMSADRLRANIAYYDVQIKAFDAKMNRSVQRAQIVTEAVKAAGQMASQLAAGAYAAMHVSATMSGQASVSSNETFTTNSTL